MRDSPCERCIIDAYDVGQPGPAACTQMPVRFRAGRQWRPGGRVVQPPPGVGRIHQRRGLGHGPEKLSSFLTPPPDPQHRAGLPDALRHNPCAEDSHRASPATRIMEPHSRRASSHQEAETQLRVIVMDPAWRRFVPRVDALVSRAARVARRSRQPGRQRGARGRPAGARAERAAPRTQQTHQRADL